MFCLLALFIAFSSAQNSLGLGDQQQLQSQQSYRPLALGFFTAGLDLNEGQEDIAKSFVRYSYCGGGAAKVTFGDLNQYYGRVVNDVAFFIDMYSNLITQVDDATTVRVVTSHECLNKK